MGRPINKKFFGNRNVGTSGSGDNAIGGEGVASVTINTVGSYTSALPTVTFSDPNLPTGVTALGTVHGKALSASVGTNGSGYQVGDLVVQHNGATGTYATWKVRSVKVVSYTIDTTGQGNFDGDERLALDSTIDSKWTTAFVIDVQGADGSHKISGSTLQQAGVWNGGTGYAAAPTHIAIDGGGDGHVTRGSGDAHAYGATSDNNGNGGFINVVYGIDSLDLVSEGDYTAITSGAKDLDYTTTGAGTGAKATITYGIKSVAIDEKGSGYTTVADAAPTFSAGAAAGTSVLTTDNNVPYNSSNQENAIIVTAQTTSGGSDKYGDIIAQKGSRRFRVRTADGTATCALVAKSNVAVNEMTIIATDANNNTYYVTKLTARKATLTQIAGGSNYVYSDDQVAPWSFAAASGIFVQIANA